jgi:hypothetical protein
LLQHTEAPPISLGWDDKIPVSEETVALITANEPSNTASVDVVDDNSKLNEHDAYRISTRQRKLRVNRRDDFLWQL